MTNGNDLAHPTNIIDPEGQFAPEYHTGLTKREYFAAMALQGILAGNEINRTGRKTPYSIAELATSYADALINALNKKF